MKINKLLIAGGNSTLLVWECLPWKKKNVIDSYLGKVEQVGFVSYQKNRPKLSMMGNELCINATIALASLSGKKGSIFTSGHKQEVAFENSNGVTSVSLDLKYRRDKNTVLFEGIGFIISADKNILEQTLLPNLAMRYNLPAFGVVTINKDQVSPFIFVKETNSIIAETACGSGSIAASIVTNLDRIKQPTGKYISVTRRKETFTVTARVDKISL